eukprot:12904721-Prorocentrum_lima.AAC.1
MAPPTVALFVQAWPTLPVQRPDHLKHAAKPMSLSGPRDTKSMFPSETGKDWFIPYLQGDYMQG